MTAPAALPLVQGALAATLAAAMLWDLLWLEIPDWVHVAVVLLFAAAAFLLGLGPWGIAAHVGSGAALFLAGAGLFAGGFWGGGDAKLLAALGLWFGFPDLLGWLLGASAAGGLLAVAALLLRRLPGGVRLPPPLRALGRPGGGIPYGVALGGAALPLLWRVPAAGASLPGVAG